MNVPQFGDQSLYLKGIATNLKPGDAFLAGWQGARKRSGSERWDFRRISKVVPILSPIARESNGWKGWARLPETVLPAADPQFYALRQRAALFGFNAPHPKTLGDQTLIHYGLDPPIPCPIGPLPSQHQTIDLDTTYPSVIAQSWLVLSKPTYQELYRVSSALEASRADFTLTGKTTRIQLDIEENLDLFDGADYRDTMVFAQSEFLEMAEVPIEDVITGATIELAKIPVGLVVNQPLAATGNDSVSGDAINEVVKISAIDGATITVTPHSPRVTRAPVSLSTPMSPRRPMVKPSRNCSAAATLVKNSRLSNCTSRR